MKIFWREPGQLQRSFLPVDAAKETGVLFANARQKLCQPDRLCFFCDRGQPRHENAAPRFFVKFLEHVYFPRRSCSK